MAVQASVGTVTRAESGGHFGIGNFVNLVRAGLEQQRLHIARHVTRNAAAGFARRRVPRMPFGMLPHRLVALHAHLIGIGCEFE